MGRAKHCTDDQRQLIKKLRTEGHSHRNIAKTIGRSKKFVSNALSPLKQQLKTGRPRKTTTRDDKRIKLLSVQDPFKSSELIRSELNINISARTVRRRLDENMLYARSSRKVPMLTKRHIKNRILFAKTHTDWVGPENGKKWRKVLWSDETKINLIGSDGKTWVRRPKNAEFHPRYTTKTFKHGGGNIMIWGCFSWYGVGPLYWIKTIMDRHVYLNILEEVMTPYAEWEMPLKYQYQQDNDPKHTSLIVKNFFADRKIDVMVWPAQSPDMNPIENLWKIVKDKIGPNKSRNKEELWAKIQEVWYDIPVSTCQKLVESMPRRCQALLKNRGHATKY